MDSFLHTWGIDRSINSPGGLLRESKTTHAPREVCDLHCMFGVAICCSYHKNRQLQVYLLQRKGGKLGAGLGKTTGGWLLFAELFWIVDRLRSMILYLFAGWIHRTTMKMRRVHELSGCKYVKVTDDGFVIEQQGTSKTIQVKIDCRMDFWFVDIDGLMRAVFTAN